MRLITLLSMSTSLLFAAPAPAPDTPADSQPLIQSVTPRAPATIILARKLTRLEATLRRQGQIIRKLRWSLRASVDTTGGLARAFLCIHSFEGSWTDPNPPFWGGVQMDMGFMQTYGAAFLRAWGTADRWPPFVQIAVAENAYLSGRGFFPWPNTARACGLL